MIKIRKISRNDVSCHVKWLNNPKVTRFLGDEHHRGTTLKKQQDWFDNYEKNKNKKFFTICDGKNPIGFMGLSNIDTSNRRADLFIAIGEDNYRGKGNGKIAISWLINYAFNKLRLHKINLGVSEENIAAIKLYQSIGFVTEGIFKDEDFYNGKYYNSFSMAIFNK